MAFACTNAGRSLDSQFQLLAAGGWAENPFRLIRPTHDAAVSIFAYIEAVKTRCRLLGVRASAPWPLSTRQQKAGMDEAVPDILDDFGTAVLGGLAQRQKAIPARYFYDRRGSDLFEEITRLPEYYPTRDSPPARKYR